MSDLQKSKHTHMQPPPSIKRKKEREFETETPQAQECGVYMGSFIWPEENVPSLSSESHIPHAHTSTPSHIKNIAVETPTHKVNVQMKFQMLLTFNILFKAESFLGVCRYSVCDGSANRDVDSTAGLRRQSS